MRVSIIKGFHFNVKEKEKVNKSCYTPLHLFKGEGDCQICVTSHGRKNPIRSKSIYLSKYASSL
mgnify:CR=1 FL=1